MMAQAQDTITTTRPARRADAGAIRLSQRDIDGLLLCGERYGCPYDLLAAAVRVPAVRLRRAGCADTGRLGPGPGWCWLTRAGMTGTGLGFPAVRPALGRLAHVRAVLAARLWLQANPAWSQGQPWWHSERRLRADLPAAGRREHVPDAEIHWPSIAASPYAGQGCSGSGCSGSIYQALSKKRPGGLRESHPKPPGQRRDAMAHRLPFRTLFPGEEAGRGAGGSGAVLGGCLGGNSRYIQHHPLRDPALRMERTVRGAPGRRVAGAGKAVEGRGRGAAYRRAGRCDLVCLTL